MLLYVCIYSWQAIFLQEFLLNTLVGMGRDRFLLGRDESRQLFRDETKFETKDETRKLHIETNRDF